MQRDPPPFIWAVPEENNILTCEYTGWFGGRPAHLKHAGNYIIVRLGSLVICISARSSGCPSVSSEDLSTPPLPVVNITVSSCSRLSTRSSHQGSRYDIPA